jgi:hypothetical protein
LVQQIDAFMTTLLHNDQSVKVLEEALQWGLINDHTDRDAILQCFPALNDLEGRDTNMLIGVQVYIHT